MLTTKNLVTIHHYTVDPLNYFSFLCQYIFSSRIHYFVLRIYCVWFVYLFCFWFIWCSYSGRQYKHFSKN